MRCIEALTAILNMNLSTSKNWKNTVGGRLAEGRDALENTMFCLYDYDYWHVLNRGWSGVRSPLDKVISVPPDPRPDRLQG